LSPAQRKVISNELRDFRLGGAELPPAQKQRFKEISERLASLSSRFNDNVLDATNAFELYIEDERRLTGIPEDTLEAARKAAADAGRSGWKFTLHMPSYLPVMQYADDRALRETMYRANATRAAEFDGGRWDNTEIIREILALRQEQARLLRRRNLSELSLTPMMAESPAQGLKFLEDLASRAKPHAVRDLQELREFARESLGLAQLEPWDVAYASEKLRVARYSFSDQEVKQYFPEDAVLSGMFRVVETLYGLRIQPDEAPRWHDD